MVRSRGVERKTASAAKNVEVRVLGPIELIVDGVVVDLIGAFGPALLAILAFEPGPHQRLDLVERLWDEPDADNEVTTKSAIDRLYTVTNTLRTAGGGALRTHLATDRGKNTLSLRRGAPLSIDFDLFADDLKHGRIDAAARRIDGVEVCQGIAMPCLVRYGDLVTSMLQKAQARRGDTTAEPAQELDAPTQPVDQPAPARRDVRTRYNEHLADGGLADLAFVDRGTTQKVIDVLGDTNSTVTLFVGAGAALDIGGPTHQLLIEDLAFKPPGAKDKREEKLISIISREFGPRFLGSAYREHAEARRRYDRMIAGDIEDALTKRLATQAPGALAATIRKVAAAWVRGCPDRRGTSAAITPGL